MVVKQMTGYIPREDYPADDHWRLVTYVVEKDLLDVYNPITVPSANWKQWNSLKDARLCGDCEAMQGRIVSARDDDGTPRPPLHRNCRCTLDPLEAVVAGTATHDGKNGADWWIKHYGKLPDYYVTREELKELQWRSSKPPAKVAPGKMLYGGIYSNSQNLLPNAPGREWYEADINYYTGRRNRHRLYWSNDGLMFVTYNHGTPFYEVI